MIIGRNFVNKYYEDEKLYSTGDDYLDEMLEKAFCDGYEYAQKEFGNPGNKAFFRNLQRSQIRTAASNSGVGNLTRKQENLALGAMRRANTPVATSLGIKPKTQGTSQMTLSNPMYKEQHFKRDLQRVPSVPAADGKRMISGGIKNVETKVNRPDLIDRRINQKAGMSTLL